MQELSSKLSGFELARYRFVIQPKEELILPEYKGSTFRGGFGNAFRRAVCTVKDSDCQECLLKSKCVYSYVFETPIPQDTEVLSKSSHVPHPFVIEPPLEDRRIYGRDDRLTFDLVLIGRAIEYLPYFIFALEELGRIGIGKGRGRYQLEEVIGLGIGEEVGVFSGKERRILSPGAKITIDKLTPPRINGIERVEVEFLTPGRFLYEEKLTSKLEFHILFRTLLRRISSLMYFHCGKRLDLDFRDMIEQAKAVSIEEDGLKWKDWERYSARQDERIKLGGVIGRISYCGPMEIFLQYLLLGEYIHVGKGTAFGLGKIKVHLY